MSFQLLRNVNHLIARQFSGSHNHLQKSCSCLGPMHSPFFVLTTLICHCRSKLLSSLVMSRFWPRFEHIDEWMRNFMIFHLKVAAPKINADFLSAKVGGFFPSVKSITFQKLQPFLLTQVTKNDILLINSNNFLNCKKFSLG